MAFVDIWIAIKEGRKTEARQRLDAVRQTIGTAATKLDRLDFELMENALK
jgi:hypothetical protein